MPRKPSKYVERAELDRVEAQYNIVRLGLHVKTYDDPDLCVEVLRDGFAYAFTLYRATQAHGGIVLITGRSMTPGMSGGSVRVMYLEDLLSEQRGTFDVWTWAADTIRRLVDKRYALLQAESKRPA